MRVSAVLAALLAEFRMPVSAVDQSKFRKCRDTGFCRRHRMPDASPPPKYAVDAGTVAALEGGGAEMILRATNDAAVPLSLKLLPHAGSDVLRVRLTDASGAPARWEAPDVLWRDDFEVLKVEPVVTKDAVSVDVGGGKTCKIGLSPFTLELVAANGNVLARVNAQQLLHFENSQRGDVAQTVSVGADGSVVGATQAAEAKCPTGQAWSGTECLEVVGYWEDGLARFADGTKEVKTYKDESVESQSLTGAVDEKGDSFAGHTDSQKMGLRSVGVDVDFPGATALFGLPEHASQFALKATRGAAGAYSEPYRFYNLDVFEYDLDVPMALYGAIPLVWAHSTSPARMATPTVGAFWLNPSETFVDVETGEQKGVHWMSESGVVDLFLISSASPLEAFAAYAQLTGPQALPPMFALGYHQCRWNYKDEKDVLTVHGDFERLDIPYDVLWLDIEHTDGKRYFTWDASLFPNPIEMQKKLSSQGRKMVTIVDPHIKRDADYPVHALAEKEGFYVKDSSGLKDYDGWCWPGSSSYLDFTSAKVRAWFATRFSLENYKGSTHDLYIWNDMNEPSVFNGPEVTMPKDVQSLSGVEHREWHNLYGMYFHRATSEGLQLREAETRGRPFVLSRSFFAGSQRFGAIWTGDNAAKWSHLEISAAMLLSINVAGLSFCGADAGGFFGDADAELMTRWLQAAAFTPFFRGHAHHDSKRREPWVYGEPTTQRLRAAIARRYALLPYWYTRFAQARKDGFPVMRPLFAHYPFDDAALTLDDQWLVGEDLLVHPVVQQGRTDASVFFPGAGVKWYQVEADGAPYVYVGPNRYTVHAPIDKIPVYQRGGSVVPRMRRLRRSTATMAGDPYELTVALSASLEADGDLYVDNGASDHFIDGAYVHRRFQWSKGVFSGSTAPVSGAAFGVAPSQKALFQPENTLERLIVLGLAAAPKSATLFVGGVAKPLETTFADGVLVVRDPGARIAEDFEITFVF
ncbi:glycosyl hydrolases family 31-domain-containing protein [Pelagophyceae sp. CCMP2097]|nr:glycosyl hydrolases family 31-domain-containing protein [Pelagophyceae sp. CCMP2097]|mmetsp:Transcript_30372/g.104882  ORF Transcript_30372/g.104882 Transcript_30372/m.104882 type:complete len:977 (-) Transcript_30372:165-3095(-)